MLVRLFDIVGTSSVIGNKMLLSCGPRLTEEAKGQLGERVNAEARRSWLRRGAPTLHQLVVQELKNSDHRLVAFMHFQRKYGIDETARVEHQLRQWEHV